MIPHSLRAITLSLVLAMATACGRELDAGAPPLGDPVSGRVVDSIFPVEEEIRRFQATVAEAPARLAGGAASRDELVSAFIRALEANDTAAIARAVLSRAEFIHLYFPHTVYVAPPYEMSPAFIWFQMMNRSSRGLARALPRFGGRELHYRGHECPVEATREGPYRVWEGCTVRIAPHGEDLDLRLFGPIIEREGHYKFATYGNEL